MIYSSVLLLVALVATASSHSSNKFVWPLTQSTPIEDRACGTNGKTTCKGEETCCKIGSTGDEYGCCPLNNAVCCSNGQSCCPTGYSCSKADGRCVKNDAVESLSTIATTSSSACNCPSSQTCCTLSDGQQGCCPVPNAVCCSDGKHCCPEGYTCDTADGKCTKGDLTMSLLKKQPSPSTVTCPDGQSECPSGNTCCKVSANRYGCCPQANAVCCSDEKHCCPSGYTCDTGNGQCSRGDQTTPLLKKQPALLRVKSEKLDSVTCPDGSACPSGNTCCSVGGDRYGCCPQEDAVCCSDHKHCCPSGYTCNTADGKCAKGDLTIPFLKKQPSIPSVKSEKLESVKCPDGQSSCPSGNTCCKTSTDDYGCCPVKDAVCCTDGVHCCPSGYTCDVADGKCMRSSPSMIDIVVSETIRSVVCPDGQSECPSGNTCCPTSSDGYGCCPVVDAVCCDDKKHCCPSGYTCDTGNGQCSKGDLTTPLLKKQPTLLRVKSEKLDSVTCPDGSACPSGNTCCSVGGDRYGCCPQEDAVCCSDDKHCCPSGYTCDTADGKCSKGDLTIPFLKKQPSIPSVKSEKLESVTCPDGSSCSYVNTCCSVGGDRYGCCPQQDAVCCSDDKHCCPSGYTCNTADGQCSKGDLTIPFLKKQPSIPSVKSEKLDSVKCADGSSCPSGNTCCSVGGDRYGCCPQEDAVCCSDDKHCCPSGYTCNTADGQCSKGDLTIPFLKKQPSIPSVKSEKLESVKCPDGSACPSGNTCCKTSTGEYGCCPVKDAVCCSDGVHCCPSGYTCDVADGKCTKSSPSIDSMIDIVKYRPTNKLGQPESIVCPDGKSECPSDNTCCKISSSEYGCCPQANAVCCSDEKHCCPSGYTCDTSDGQCSRGDLTMALLKKQPAMPVKSKIVRSVVCPDGESQCPTGNTCCQLSNGRWGCCPVNNAVCCSDGIHCCPEGKTCNLEKNTCDGEPERVEQVPVALPAVVVCPNNKVSCPYQCCRGASSSSYKCCPISPRGGICCPGVDSCCKIGQKCVVSGTKATCENTEGDQVSATWLEHVDMNGQL